MSTVRSYTHPLDGAVGGAEPRRSSVRRIERRLWVWLALGVAHVAGLIAAGSYVWSLYQSAWAAKAAILKATQAVEYEPLSHTGDGSYAEEAGGGRESRSLGVLRRLRARRE